MSKPVEFSASQLEAFKVTFDEIDQDKSGFITIDELSVLLGKIGEDNSEEATKSLIKELDRNDDGNIFFQIEKLSCWEKQTFNLIWLMLSFKEFVVIAETLNVAVRDLTKMRAAFKAFDKNKDGTITKQELK